MADNSSSNSAIMQQQQQVRLMMLTFSRSTSTVFTKCLSFVEDSLVIAEPYFSAQLFGPNRIYTKNPDKTTEEALTSFMENASRLVTDFPARAYDVSLGSYEWVKEQLEASYDDKKFIFCKDMAFGLTGHEIFLPRGYRYMFLIRHPLKVFPSLKKAWQKLIDTVMEGKEFDELHESIMPPGKGYREMSDLLDHVRDKHDQEAIIIDSDDLLENPRGILSALFKAIGLPFDEKLLTWEAGNAVTKSWFISKYFWAGDLLGEYYKKAFDSTCFQKPGDLPDRSSLSPDILRCVDASMPYYEKMYAQRIKPE